MPKTLIFVSSHRQHKKVADRPPGAIAAGCKVKLFTWGRSQWLCDVAFSFLGARGIGDVHVLGPFLRDVAKLNSKQRNFRVFGPDETLSNGLEALFQVTQRQWDAATLPNDEFLARDGRVLDSMLSEHQCEGWLEGYLLTGRHGLFNCYEAFIHIIDSMFNQHAKWLKVTAHLPWWGPIASPNYV